MKLSEHIKIFKRSLQYLFTLSRTHMVCLILGGILQNLIPYVPIYFSARLLDALYEGQPVDRLFVLVLLTVGIVFLLSLTAPWLSSARSPAYHEMYRHQPW